MIFLKFVIAQVVLTVQILHSLCITYRIKWKKNFHGLQGLHGMLPLYHLNLIKNGHIHTHISSCLWLTFSFFEYIYIRFLPISKPLTCCFLCFDHPGIFKRTFKRPPLLILHMSASISPRKIILVHIIYCLYSILVTLYTHLFISASTYYFTYYVWLICVSITYLLLLENRFHKNRYFLVLMLSF